MPFSDDVLLDITYISLFYARVLSLPLHVQARWNNGGIVSVMPTKCAFDEARPTAREGFPVQPFFDKIDSKILYWGKKHLLFIYLARKWSNSKTQPESRCISVTLLRSTLKWIPMEWKALQSPCMTVTATSVKFQMLTLCCHSQTGVDSTCW